MGFVPWLSLRFALLASTCTSSSLYCASSSDTFKRWAVNCT